MDTQWCVKVSSACNRDADKEAKLTDCSFNIKQIQNILNGNIAQKKKTELHMNTRDGNL